MKTCYDTVYPPLPEIELVKRGDSSL